MPKFNIGDKVWYAATQNIKTHLQCPGSGVITVRFADDKEIAIACVTCVDRNRPTGRVSYFQYKPFVRMVRICGMEVQPDKTTYRFNTNHLADESEFFSDKEGAELRAKELAEKATLGEMNKFNAKEKPTRTWAWNATYYRKRLKSAQAEVAYYTEKLSAAKIKAKTSQSKMCEFLSFVITKDGRVLANNLSSHEGIESLHKLWPDTYREAEWTGEDYDSLTVRVAEGEVADEYLSHVQSRFKSRKDLLNYFLKNPKSIGG